MNRFYLSAGLMALVSGAPALAQTAPAPAPQASAADQANFGLQDIIVTAQRRSENLQNVPIAVVAVTPDQLTNSGVTNLQGLNVLVPGVQMLQGAANSNPYIRGVGSQQVGPGLEAPIAIYVDGVYYASNFGAPAELVSVAQVEVLKGPQGTLFGRNATGGLIHIITRTPSHDAQVEARASYGNYDTKRFEFYGTTGLGANLAADFSAAVSSQGDGYGTNLVNGRDINRVDLNVNLRSKWLFTPSDATQITAIFDYGVVHSSLNAARIIPGTGVPPIIGPLYGGSAWDAALSTHPKLNSKGGGASLKIEHDLGFAELVNIAAWRKSHTTGALDLDATATNFTSVSDLAQKERQITEELQLQSNKGAGLDWTLGLYYFNDVAKIDESVALGPIVRPPFTGQRYLGRQETTSYAAYGQATWEFLPDTRLTLGGRYTHEKRAFEGSSAALAGPVVIPLVAGISTSKSFDRFTYRVALDHRFSPELLVYASVNSGFKSGGYNALAPDQPPFNPEKLMAYAAGIKSDLLDRRLRLNLEGFYYDYKDLQVGVVLQLAPGVTAPGIINGGTAEVYGLDLDMQAQITDGLRISGGLAYLHSRFKDTVSNFAISSPSGMVPTYLGSVQGNTLPYSPDLIGSVSADYTVPVGEGEANFNVTYQYNDGFFAEPDNVVRQNSYSMLAASMRWTAPDERLSLSIWGKNLTNKAAISNALTLAFGPHEAYYQPPRTYGATVGFKF
ncbi:MAG: TonB-dependent receptor [Sphingobium sp.]